MAILDPFLDPSVVLGDILAAQWPSKTHSKPFGKNLKISMILGSPQGEHAIATGREFGQQKTHIFSKSSVFAAEGCKFSVSGFRYPLREVNFIDFL